jgi:hypothetical protein
MLLVHFTGSANRRSGGRLTALYIPAHLPDAAEYMDPYTLAYLAGQTDFGTTRRYVHPQAQTIRDAMARARKDEGGHKNGHNGQTPLDAESHRLAVVV